ncbi:MAG: YhgE/Pip domain-containing protein [Nocardioidaceae bacterium]
MIRRPALTRVLAGTLLLPMLFGALVVWSLSDRAERSDAVPAAVVNLDRPVFTGHGKDRQVVYAGRLLAAGLTQPDRPRQGGLGWQLTDAQDAQQGLRDGDYYAVVTIPRGFSRTLSGIASDPRSAQVTVQSSDSSSALAGEVGHQVTDVALDRLGHRVTATYLQGVLGRTGGLKDKLGQAADGAGRLAAGARQAGDGASRLGTGAGALAGGLGTLASGTDRLGAGADRLHAGTGRLADGAGRLAGGADRLAGGLGALHGRTAPLPGRTRQLADGARRVSGGVGPYTQIVKAWEQACTTDPVVAGAHPQLCAATIRAAGPTGGNADRLAAGARQVADGAGALASATPRLVDAIGQVSAGAHRLAGGAHRLTAGAGLLDEGAARLSAGAGQIADGARRAQQGAVALADGGSRLATGTGSLANGGDRLASGLRHGADQVPAVKDAAHQARVVADPVSARSATLDPARDGSTLLAPAVLALALWLGAFVTYLVRPALPARLLRAAVPAWRVTAGGWLPAVLTGLVQAALLLGALVALGTHPVSPLGVAAAAALCALVFTAVNQAFVAVLGAGRGWLIAIAFAVVQLVSLGGLLPITTAPGSLQVLNGVLPLSRAADLLGRLVLGGAAGTPGADVLVLLVWLVAALAVTTVAARRRRRLTVADVRRQVEEPLPAT